MLRLGVIPLEGRDFAECVTTHPLCNMAASKLNAVRADLLAMGFKLNP
jgi:hypothetical protein